MATAPLGQLLALVDEGFNKKAWHGPTLLGSIRGLTPAQAAWRPAPGRHNIWELTVHAAYWKYTVRQRLTGGKRGAFRLKGSNWFERPAANTVWKADVALLVDEHRLLRETIAALPAAALDKPLRGKPYSAGFTIRGIAAHDLYHAGQIQLLKKLQA